MDGVTSLLDGPRAHQAFLLRVLMEPPWAMRIEDRAPLTVVAVTSGHAWLVNDTPVRLVPGDVAIIRGLEPYVVADDPITRPGIVIHPGERCTTTAGVDLVQTMNLGVRTWGNSAHGSTMLLVGSYQMDSQTSHRLLDALPPSLVVSTVDGSLLSLLGNEIVRDEPGQKVVLDRLLDLVLVSALREWFAADAARAPGWFRALGDPVVGQALRLMHDEPAHPWTVAALARRASVSRAALARRFTELVGEPPMTFLTGWRLDLAADLLREPGVTVGAVAGQVGYGTAFALSAAFKRVRGISPREHRAAAG